MTSGTESVFSQSPSLEHEHIGGCLLILEARFLMASISARQQCSQSTATFPLNSGFYMSSKRKGSRVKVSHYYEGDGNMPLSAGRKNGSARSNRWADTYIKRSSTSCRIWNLARLWTWQQRSVLRRPSPTRRTATSAKLGVSESVPIKREPWRSTTNKCIWQCELYWGRHMGVDHEQRTATMSKVRKYCVTMD